MKKKLYIIGAGSVGVHVALNIREYSEEFEIAGFFDDDPEKIGTKQYGLGVLGDIHKALELENASVVVGIAFPKIKQKILDKLSRNSSLRYPSLIHKRAWISNAVSIGRGCIIYPGTTINFGSEINDFVVINQNCSLGHNTTIGNYSSLAPGVKTGGHTAIRESVDMGIGSATIQDVHIGEYSVVGGQSMVINNVDPGCTVAGIPAKIISQNVPAEER